MHNHYLLKDDIFKGAFCINSDNLLLEKIVLSWALPDHLATTSRVKRSADTTVRVFMKNLDLILKSFSVISSRRQNGNMGATHSSNRTWKLCNAKKIFTNLQYSEFIKFVFKNPFIISFLHI